MRVVVMTGKGTMDVLEKRVEDATRISLQHGQGRNS